jgi:ferric-dicitrate binding protein FerR (iron transport regulator)
MIEEDKLYELIVKELTSDISEQESEMLHNYISLNPEIKSKYNSIEKYWRDYFPTPVSNNVVKKAERKIGFSFHSSKRKNPLFFYRIAASFVLVFSLAYFSYYMFREKPQESLNEYYAGSGQVRNIILADSTKVWLNTGSLLIASEPFTKENREVMLFGEGYFEVAHNPDQPFIVKTATLRTKVLGTHFNISAYPNDEKQEISLYEGSIELSGLQSSRKKLAVNPGEKVFYTHSNDEFNVITTDLGNPAEWRDGILRFYDEDLSTIAKKLERKFQTKIVIIDEKVGNMHFTANFEEESLIKIIELLKEAHEFAFKKYDNSIIIQSKNK